MKASKRKSCLREVCKHSIDFSAPLLASIGHAAGNAVWCYPCAEPPWPQAPGSARTAPGTIFACAPSISHFRRPCLAVADEGPLPQAPQPQRLQGNASKTGARKQAQAEYSHVRCPSRLSTRRVVSFGVHRPQQFTSADACQGQLI